MGSNNRTTASDQGAAIADIPNTPTIGTVTVTGATATVPATAAATGGKFVNFLATSSPGGYTGTSTTSPITVRNLMGSTAYTFTVQVQNERFNSSASSASNSVTSGVPSSITQFVSSNTSTTFGIASVSPNDIVSVPAYRSNAGPYRANISSFDATTTEVFERELTPASGDIFGQYSTVDSSGNIYISGEDSSVTPRGSFVAKYNSSGTIQWQRRFNGTSVGSNNGVLTDASNNVYVYGYTQDSNNYYWAWFAKLNSSGTVQWRQRYRYAGGTGTSAAFAYSGAIDSSFVYFTGYVDTNTGYTAMYSLKLSQSDGSRQFDSRYNRNSGSSYGYSTAVDSSGNVFTGGANGDSRGVIMKLNSSGSLQWVKTIRNTSDNYLSNFKQMACDPSGNVYAASQNSWNNGSTNKNTAYIVKYDTNGTIQWQRRIRITANPSGGQTELAPTEGSGLSATSTHFYITTNTGFLFKLPTDGTNTGTYTFNGYTFVYEAVTNTTEETPGYQFGTTIGTVNFQSDSIQSATTTTYTDSAGTVVTGVVQRF